MKEKRKSKAGRNPKLDPAVYRYTVRFNEEEHNRFLAMFGKSGVYARSVFLKAHFFGQPFKVLKVDKTLVDYYTKLSDFHAQFRAVGTNYNQVVKELRLHFSEKKAMALLYKLEQGFQRASGSAADPHQHGRRLPADRVRPSRRRCAEPRIVVP